MKIGMTLTPYMSKGETAQQSIDELLWAVRKAEDSDFDIVWTSEHHFKPSSFSGSPSVLLTQFAAITKRIKIGYAVAIIPLHHPVRLAEDMAWVDQFSGGRLIVGASPGWAAYEFDVLGVDIKERQDRYEEGLKVVRQALKGGAFSHEGKFWNLKDVEVLPPTHQEGGPPFMVAATSENSTMNAARWRVSPIFGFEKNDRIAELRARYSETATADGASEDELAGLLGSSGVLRRLIVCDTDEEAEQEAMDSVEGFTRSSRKLLANQQGEQVEGVARGEHSAVDDPRESYAFGGTIWGSPETVVNKLLELHEMGIGHAVLSFHTNTRDRAGTRENITRFAKDVLPAYRARLAETVAA